MTIIEKPQAIRINRSKVVHLYWEGCDRTDCGAGGMSNISQLGGVVTDEPISCKKCVKALEKLAARREAATAEQTALMDELHEEALAIEFERTHTAHWAADSSGIWTGRDGTVLVCDLPVQKGTFGHAGPCYDRVAGEWRHALTLSPSQRKAARRGERAKARRRAPQTRAAATARRVRRGAARATAKALLVASGVPQDVASQYASAFSRGTQAPKVPTRIRKANGRTERDAVKRYTWDQFTERLSAYRPADARPAMQFERAASKVCA
jgi:hypothetical protein